MTRTIPPEPCYQPPSFALDVLNVLEEHGFEAWIVGGWVRDALINLPSHDVDITTSARWEQSAKVMRDAGFVVQETGTKHGTITVISGGHAVEVTTFRVDGNYSDHRHPDEVRFVESVEEDLGRRDFTVNAMAYHPERGLLDPFGGRQDLQDKLIRAVGDPAKRFAEDALRVMRAVRFACRMGFEVESATHEALVEAAPGLADVAQERIGKELNGIVASGRAGWALRHETDVMCAAVPEFVPMRGFDQRSTWHSYDVMEHTARVCNAVEAFTAGVAPLELRWAALLHDVGKPACFVLDDRGRGHFYGHPVAGAEMAEWMMQRMGLPGPLIEGAVALVRYHDHVVRPTARSMRRTLAVMEEAVPGRALQLSYELMDIKRADAVSKQLKCASYAIDLDQMDAILREEQRGDMVLRVTDLAISGKDVIDFMGIEPGPMVGMVLSRLLAAVVDNEVENTREALFDELMIQAQELD